MIYETIKSFTELWERFVEVLRNHVPPTELKKVANKNHETFWDPPNLKSFGGEVANFQSSGKDLFFLECRLLWTIIATIVTTLPWNEWNG